MANTESKIITLKKLGTFKDEFMKYVDSSDAKSYKSVRFSDYNLEFYTVENPTAETVAAKVIELPKQDLSDLLAKINKAVAGDVVIANADGTIADGGVKLTDLATNTSVKEAQNEVETKIGSLSNLTTTNKADLVVALNEVSASVEAGGTGSVVTISTETTTEGYAKSYTFKQGKSTLGTIDIPKDMVVSNGTVEIDPKGQEAGTYLVLTLANATNDKVYINVGKLVDIYKAAEKATQVQVAVDSTTREISATIVANSVTATELATNSIVTTKIADGNVTKAKLSTDVQSSLGKADTALQASDITTLEADVAANKASLAEGGATTKAIADAKKAGTDAQSSVDALTSRVSTLESMACVEATDDEIKALFAQ